MSNPNNDKLLQQLFSSDFVKSLIVMCIFLISITWTLENAKNDIDKSITAIANDVKIQNMMLENRIEKLELKQENDINYIKENFQRKK